MQRHCILPVENAYKTKIQSHCILPFENAQVQFFGHSGQCVVPDVSAYCTIRLLTLNAKVTVYFLIYQKEVYIKRKHML